MPRVRRAPPWCSPLRAVVVLCVLGAGFWLYARTGGDVSYFGSPIARRPAPPLDLTTDRGQPFDLAALRGDIVLVYFGYTDCPDVCPTTLADLARITRDLGSVGSRVRVVFVTLDPRHDHPALLRKYLAVFDPSFIGLTGSAAAIAAAAKDWNISWHRVAGHQDFIDHSSTVTLVGPRGEDRLRYGVTQIGNSAAVTRDLRRILTSG